MSGAIAKVLPTCSGGIPWRVGFALSPKNFTLILKILFTRQDLWRGFREVAQQIGLGETILFPL
jgi:hypothetical protein